MFEQVSCLNYYYTINQSFIQVIIIIEMTVQTFGTEQFVPKTYTYL